MTRPQKEKKHHPAVPMLLGTQEVERDYGDNGRVVPVTLYWYRLRRYVVCGRWPSLTRRLFLGLLDIVTSKQDCRESMLWCLYLLAQPLYFAVAFLFLLLLAPFTIAYDVALVCRSAVGRKRTTPTGEDDGDDETIFRLEHQGSQLSPQTQCLCIFNVCLENAAVGRDIFDDDDDVDADQKV